MKKFTTAIVRTPSKSLINGISSANLGSPDYEKALKQHNNYIEILESCGLKVSCLDADENFPDSVFVEDVAIVTKKCAVITNPGAASRNGEVHGWKDILKTHFSNVENIEAPGTLEGGDVMMVDDHFYIGLSERTNAAGARQLTEILQQYGMTASTIVMEEMLHLKTGLAYLENNFLLACGEFLNKSEFSGFDILEIEESEAYAANCIWLNGTVLVPLGFPKAKKSIAKASYPVIELDVSEFQKLDGGLSCLSLRF